MLYSQNANNLDWSDCVEANMPAIPTVRVCYYLCVLCHYYDVSSQLLIICCLLLSAVNKEKKKQQKQQKQQKSLVGL
jgi:hypothetical protein